MLVIAFPAFADSSLNPYNSLLYEHIQAQGQSIQEFGWRRVVRLQRPDVLHVHWPERQILFPGWRPRKLAEFALFRLFLWATRLRGGKVAWTAHNAFAHDTPRSRFNLRLWTNFLSQLDGVIYLSEESKRQIQADYPVLRAKKSVVIQHGDYLDWLSAMNARAARDRYSRQALGIPPDAKVLLSFGLIRPHKGIDQLIEQFRLLDGNTHLIISGKTTRPQLRQKIEKLALDRPNIHLFLRWAEGEELAALLEMSDLVVLPYRTITNSGAALLALSARIPILGPNMGSIPELQRLAGAEWVRLFDGSICGSHLRDAIAWLGLPRSAPNLEPFAWPRLAGDTLAFYRSLLSN